jgi:predicted DNA-binding transcriptional regulator AlpA
LFQTLLKEVENMPENEELDLKETLIFLGIGRSSLYRLMETGKIQPSNRTPLLSRPGRLKFRKSDLERLIRDAREAKNEAKNKEAEGVGHLLQPAS